MESANPPVQIRLEGMPANNTFVLIPRHNPSLAKHIDSLIWRAVAKSLHLNVDETPDLDVFRWMEYMRNRQREIKEGPFVNLDEDALVLCIKDGAGRPLGCLKFMNLSLEEHSCYFDKDGTGALSHSLIIQYQEVKSIPVSEEPTNLQKAVDEEWQRV